MSKIKIILAAAAIVISTFGATAQGLYFKLGGGYNFPFGVPAQTLRTENPVDPSVYFPAFKTEKVSYGSGINIDGGLGFMLSKHIGLELNASYILSKEFNSKQSYILQTANEEQVRFTEGSSSLRMLRLIPSFVISSGGERINLYGRFGFVIGVLGKATTNVKTNMDIFNFNPEPINIDYKIERSGNIATGLASAAGVSVKITKMFSVFGEATIFNMAYYPSKGSFTEYNKDNISMLHTLPNSKKEEEFLAENNTVATEDPTKPAQRPLLTYPMNSVGLNLGIKFNL